MTEDENREWIESMTRFYAEQSREEARSFLGWANWRSFSGSPERGDQKMRSWVEAAVASDERRIISDALARGIEATERYLERGCVVCGKLPNSSYGHSYRVSRGDGWQDEEAPPPVCFCDDCAKDAIEQLQAHDTKLRGF